jgi:polygalacturonase
MNTKFHVRREFLKRAGLTAAGGALTLCSTPAVAEAAEGLDVKTFGATGDGKTLDTAAINKAIDAAAAAGGGIVMFPAGNYLSFSIHLKSNITLALSPGATVIAADTPAGGGGYDAAEPNKWDMYQDFGHSHFHNSLIWGEGLENIAIVGSGRIWGKGLNRGLGPQNPGMGNKSIALKDCHNVLLRDFSILHGGHFGILANGIDNFTIDNLKIDTQRDGMDVDCCRNVRISNCYVNSPWDDGICLKADYALGSAKQTEFVTITNCYVSGCWEEGTLLDGTYKRFAPEVRVPHTGRIKFGTESNGGFRNITISNCVFEGCQGLALETVDGALLEDVTVTNISMRDIITAPIFLRLGRRMRGPEGTPIGTLKRILISNVVCSGTSARLGSVISGIPGHLIEDVKISNFQVQHAGGGTREDAAFEPPELEDVYPEPTMFTAPPRQGNGRGAGGTFAAEGQGAGRGAGGRAPQPPQPGRGPATPPVQRNMPSHGFYVRHVKGIEFDNIDIRAAKEDARPAFVLDDVQDADFSHVKVPQAPGVPIFAMRDVSDFRVRQCTGVKDTELPKVDRKTL